ncbi:MAG: hypothetical protein JO034_20515, partial [Singulisphaera sp.]|nr:hypothetical protein [Singulisphaera sp.]
MMWFTLFAEAATIAKTDMQSIMEMIPSLLWALLAIGATVYFRRELWRLLSTLVLRLHSGSALKLGPVEFAALGSIPA